MFDTQEPEIIILVPPSVVQNILLNIQKLTCVKMKHTSKCEACIDLFVSQGNCPELEADINNFFTLVNRSGLHFPSDCTYLLYLQIKVTRQFSRFFQK